MISMEELNPHGYPTAGDIGDHLSVLLDRMNRVRSAWGKPMIVTSGLRSQADQERINPSAPKSKHLTGQACDIQDQDGSLRDWVLGNLQLMTDIGLWFEDFRWTPGWVHFQVVPPASGHRIFVPSSKPATNPRCWDGTYDKSFDSI